MQSLSFPNASRRSWSMSRAQNLWYHRKGLVIRHTHAKYESPISKGNRVISKQKVWQTGGQTDGRTDGRRANWSLSGVLLRWIKCYWPNMAKTQISWCRPRKFGSILRSTPPYLIKQFFTSCIFCSGWMSCWMSLCSTYSRFIFILLREGLYVRPSKV